MTSEQVRSATAVGRALTDEGGPETRAEARCARSTWTGRQREPARPEAAETIVVELVHHVDFLVQTYCRHLGLHDREDIAQDALSALIGAQVPADNPKAWLVTVVRNLRAQHCRAWHRAGVVLSWLDVLYEPSCRADPWADLARLLDEVAPPFSGEEKEDLCALAAGRTRRQLAAERGEKPDKTEARIKKSLERLRIFLGAGDNRDSATC